MKQRWLRTRAQMARMGEPASKAQVSDGIITDIVFSIFPFMKLPPEIRNKIYRLTVFDPQRDCSNADVIRQPGLLRCSRQTRTEGLMFFYENRAFFFPTHQTNQGLKHLLSWLKNIGPVASQSIHKMVVESNLRWSDVATITEIHTKLSDEATVTYVEHLPYWHPAGNIESIRRLFNGRRPGETLFIQRYEGTKSLSMTFFPGRSWFGTNYNPTPVGPNQMRLRTRKNLGAGTA